MAARIEASTTSVSWIPMEAIAGSLKLPFEVGVAHYDPPPPDRIDLPTGIDVLRQADRFRFCNHLAAWIEVDGGKISGAGYLGGGVIGSTTLKLGAKATFQAVAYPDIQAEPEVGANYVRFVQTAGGRTGVPAPRAVKHPPFVQIAAPTAWTTLSLSIFADGTTQHELTGASPFPRHWVYDGKGALTEKSATIDYKEWSGKAFGKHSPWGNEDSPAVVTAVESATERALSAVIIDAKPAFRKVKKGGTLVQQGDGGDEIFLLFDGVCSVEQDGEVVAEFGPGAVLGEMAIVGDGKRNATLRALTDCRVAVAPGSAVDRSALEQIADTRLGDGG
jgi:Cyclic nucleotide-binding domain